MFNIRKYVDYKNSSVEYSLWLNGVYVAECILKDFKFELSYKEKTIYQLVVNCLYDCTEFYEEDEKFYLNKACYDIKILIEQEKQVIYELED